MRWVRYQADARTSSMGTASSAACSDALAISDSSSRCPSRAASTRSARIGVGAAAPMATRTPCRASFFKTPATPSDIVEISSAGRGPDFRNRAMKPSAGTANSIAVSSSSLRLFVIPGPAKNSAMGMNRETTTPSDQLASTTSASSSSSGMIMSPAGEALHRLPPIVAALRN